MLSLSRPDRIPVSYTPLDVYKRQGGGYYFRLITEDGRTLPSEIFDEAGGGVLWLLAEAEEYDLSLIHI